MAFYPEIEATAGTRTVTDTFLGYQHKLRIPDGAWWDMENLTGEQYPLLATRQRRGLFHELERPQGLAAKDSLAWVVGSTLYYNGAATGLTALSQPTIYRQEEEPGVAGQGAYWFRPSTGVTKRKTAAGWLEAAYPQKQLVSMGAYLCVFPDKMYLNTADLTDYGSMEAAFTAAEDTAVSYQLTLLEGGDVTGATVSPEPPAAPESGDYWIDTSGGADVLRRYSSYGETWTEVSTVYVKITAPNIGVRFAQYDGVTLSGCEAGEGRTAAQIEALNGSHVIYDRGGDYITVVGILRTAVQQTGGVTVTRTVPDLDYVCEAGNRLWGCYYGLRDGEPVNELYCCALGDFRNWDRFLGISTDSWAASCGSDGQWTGAVNYMGSPTFFKEEHIHQISISSQGAHQVVDYAAEGVQKGSWKSLAVVGSTLYYKSRRHVCAYQGGIPAVVSEDLGSVDYGEASAGAYGDRYYISMRSGSGWSLFVYDTARGFWHREDGLQCLGFAAAEGDLYALGTTAIWALMGSQGTEETGLDWSATSGILYAETVDRKYVSRYDLRLRMERGGELKIYLMYDSSGLWEEQGTVRFVGLSSVMVPIRPRRCDHLMIRLQGKGEVRVFSIARVLKEGSDLR